MKSLVTVIGLAIALPVATPAQTRTAADYMAAIERAQPPAGSNELSGLTVTELMTRFNVPGVSVAVIRDFQIHWAKGYGIADVATGAPVNTETMFQAASISKWDSFAEPAPRGYRPPVERTEISLTESGPRSGPKESATPCALSIRGL